MKVRVHPCVLIGTVWQGVGIETLCEYIPLNARSVFSRADSAVALLPSRTYCAMTSKELQLLGDL